MLCRVFFIKKEHIVRHAPWFSYLFTVLESTFDTVPAAIKFTAASTTPFTPTNATRNGQMAFVGRLSPAIVDMNVSLLQKNTMMHVMKKSVFSSAVASDAMKYDAVFIFPVLCNALKRRPESHPHSTLGTMQVMNVATGFSPRSSAPKPDAPKH